MVESKGTISILGICKGLETINHPFKGFYPTGKPKAFAYVSMVMEQMVKQEVIKLEEARLDDRWYSVI